MTVEELFDRFKEYFDKILYLDKSHNIYDKAEKEDSELPNLQTMHYKFIKNYGECEVTYWEYSHDENGIYVEIESEADVEMSELEKLASLLTEAKIPFLKTDGLSCGTQIVYSYKGNRVCDAICNEYSCGSEVGLLEIMGLVDEKKIGDVVEGRLTADEVFSRIKKHWEEHKNENS